MSDRSWLVQFPGGKCPIGTNGVDIGRDPGCAVRIDDPRVSWLHARIEVRAGELYIVDLDSSNGTFVEGTRIDGSPTRVQSGRLVTIGGTSLRIVSDDPISQNSGMRFRRITFDGVLTLGRAPDNDIVLSEPNVSWRHARIAPGNPAVLEDLGSRNGIRLGDDFVRGKAALKDGVVAGIGPFGIRLDRGALLVTDERESMCLQAENVTVEASGRTILRPTSIGVTSGEMISLIGPSGSGKSTLIKCMSGVVRPSGGRVALDGSHLSLRLTEVGYVPQSDVVHGHLTLREALSYAARLRLPSDSRTDERKASVDRVIADLGLEEHQNTKVFRLSGGQRKRVACGIELIGRPAMLMLDEPTSGLDPALERQMMSTLRDLANGGRGIVVVTHATTSLSLCDTVAVMGRGGELVFVGPPSAALEHFGVTAYDDIYTALELRDTPSPAESGTVKSERSPRGRLLSGRSLAWQTAALTSRYAKTFFRDRRTLAVQVLQVPVIGVLIAQLYPRDLLGLGGQPPGKSAQFVFLLVTASLWFGLIGSCREIAKERLIAMRELAVGIRLDAYLFSKTSVLFVFTAIQVLAMLAVALAFQPLYAPRSSYIEFAILMILAGWAAVGIGLVVSTLAKSVDQATSFIPLLLLPLLLFGGALVPRHDIQMPVKVITDVTPSRWAFASGGNIVEMERRLGDDELQPHNPEEIEFFSLEPVLGAVILLGFTAGMMLLTAALLAARSGRPFDE